MENNMEIAPILKEGTLNPQGNLKENHMEVSMRSVLNSDIRMANGELKGYDNHSSGLDPNA